MAPPAADENLVPSLTIDARPLRAWQAEAIEKYETEAPTDFLVTATPGAGKTTFGLALAEPAPRRPGDRPDHRRRARPTTCAPSGPTRRCGGGWSSTPT